MSIFAFSSCENDSGLRNLVKMRQPILCFLQETFRHFVQLARILRIDDDIPQPYNVFLGRHFVALFMEVEKAVEQGWKSWLNFACTKSRLIPTKKKLLRLSEST